MIAVAGIYHGERRSARAALCGESMSLISGAAALEARRGSGLAESEDGWAEGVELFGGDAADVAQVLEAGGCGEGDVAQNRVRKDEEAWQAGGFGGFATPVFEAGFEG